MLCYLDRTFCSAECKNLSCNRQLTKEVIKGAEAWWSHDPDNAPIALSDFSSVCSEYQPPTNYN